MCSHPPQLCTARVLQVFQPPPQECICPLLLVDGCLQACSGLFPATAEGSPTTH